MSVVGVAGAYRTGKSYLLNRVILNTNKGFGVGSTINACTKGIWIWGRPLKTQSADNRIVNMIIMDSEGLGSLEADASYDCRIFSLILLMSSMFLYNSSGAIDENSISSLSVVINITKHLTVKATSNMKNSDDTSLSETTAQNEKRTIEQSESGEITEFAKYFPDFFWILRDFSLQMVDEYGDEISPDQYLENALQSSDEISIHAETKNKIRDLIRAFFRQRKCFPLVRPVINEDELSKLDSLKMENLRAEFVEAALHFKNTIMQNARVKKVNEKEINGDILGSILGSYVDTMNNGGVPNIENTWFYVTQKQSANLMAKTIEMYQNTVKLQVKSLIPSSKTHLKDCLENAKDLAITFFKKSSFLAQSEQKDFKRKIVDRIHQEEKIVLQENDTEFEKLLENAMSNNYRETIYTPLLSEAIKESKELIDLLRTFKSNFESIEPNGPKKMARIHRFLYQKACESFGILLKNTDSRSQANFNEKIRECDLKIDQMQEEIRNLTTLKNESVEKIQQCQARLSTADFENSKLSESIKFLQEEKERLELEYESARSEDKSLFKRKTDELIKKLDDAKASQKNLESNFSHQKSEFEVELSLLNQRIEFYVNIEKDLNDQKNKLTAKHKELEETFDAKIKKMMNEFETRIAEKVFEINTYKNEKIGLEDELTDLKAMSTSFQVEMGGKEQEMHTTILKHSVAISDLKSKIVSFEAMCTALTDEKSTLEDKIKELKSETTSSEKRLKEKEDKIKSITLAFEANIELLKQENEFLKAKVEELTQEINEIKKMKELSSQVLQKTVVSKSDVNVQLQEIKSNYEQKITRMVKDNDTEKEELVQALTTQSEEYEQKITGLKEEKEKLYFAKIELQKAIENSNAKVKHLEEKVATFEIIQASNFKKKVDSLEEKVRQLIAEKENILNDKEEELFLTKQVFENNLANMRMVFENEKTILDKKLTEEKTVRESLIKESLEEMAFRKENELSFLEEEIECLKNELLNQDAKFKSTVGKLLSENNDLKTKIDSSERKTLEATNSTAKKHSEEITRLKLQLANVENEKCLAEEKLNSVKNELNSKSMEIFKFKQTIGSHNSTMQKLLGEKEKATQDYGAEISELKSKVEKIDSEKFQIGEELIQNKIYYTKELALKTQKIEYIENKIAELSSFNETVQRDCDEKVKLTIAKCESDIEDIKSKLAAETDVWTTRYEEKKKLLKESESSVTSKIAELEKARYILQEKYNFLESKKSETEENAKAEVGKLEVEVKKYREALVSEKSVFAAELESTRKEKYELEAKLNEVMARQDKDKAIFEAKISFMEQQTKKLKSDLLESQSSFDAMFQNFQQFRANDKEETENSHVSYVISLEERYSSQIQDLKDQNKSLGDMHKQKVKALEKEIKRLEEVLEESTTQKFETNMAHEKKINDLTFTEKNLLNEIEQLKSMNSHLLAETQKDLIAKSEMLQKRISEQEAKIKLIESEKSMLIFKQEKMKTNWNIEKDHLMSNKTDLLETIDRIKKQSEMVNRENDKLKNELKMSKKSNILGSFMNLGPGKGGLTSLSRNEGGLKELSNFENRNQDKE